MKGALFMRFYFYFYDLDIIKCSCVNMQGKLQGCFLSLLVDHYACMDTAVCVCEGRGGEI